MANISVTDDLIKIKKGKKLYENDFDNLSLKEIYNLSTELIESLIELNIDWKKNNNVLVFNVVSKLIKYVQKFKKLNFDEKKNLANQILKNIFNKIIKNKNLNENVKNNLIDGYDIVIEPSIDLSLQTLHNKIEFKNKFLKLCKK